MLKLKYPFFLMLTCFSVSYLLHAEDLKTLDAGMICGFGKSDKSEDDAKAKAQSDFNSHFDSTLSHVKVSLSAPTELNAPTIQGVLPKPIRFVSNIQTSSFKKQKFYGYFEFAVSICVFAVSSSGDNLTVMTPSNSLMQFDQNSDTSTK